MCEHYLNTIKRYSQGIPPEYMLIEIKEGVIRGFRTYNGELWFCLNDLAKAFGNKNVKKFRSRADKSNLKKLSQLPTEGVPQEYPLGIERVRKDSLFVNEEEMWGLMLKGRTPICLELHQFLKKHVLPQVIRTGSYVASLEDETDKWVNYCVKKVKESQRGLDES